MERHIIKVLGFIYLMQTMVLSHPDGTHEFCASVRHMYQQCDIYRNVDNNTSWKRGKAGPKGDKGERGRDTTVDYDVVERMLQRKFDNATAELRQKCVELQSIVDRHSAQLREITEAFEAMTITDCSKVDSTRLTREDREIFEIFVAGKKLNASCDQGWTIIQRRMDGSEDFFRGHADYVKGFGNVSREFWIGLDNLHHILQTADHFELQIDMEDWDGVKKYAKYSLFDVGGSDSDYILTVTGYSGNATDSFSRHSGAKFSTKDHDSDTHSGHCAITYKAGWWYTACHNSNLNGLYHQGGANSPYGEGINWQTWKGYHYSLKFVEMKIKPVRA